MVYDNDCKYNLFRCKLTKKEERVIEPESDEEMEPVPQPEKKEEESALRSVTQLGERMAKQLSKMGITADSENSGLYLLSSTFILVRR